MNQYGKKHSALQNEPTAGNVVAGRNAVIELLKSGRSVDKIFLADHAEGSVKMIAAMAKQAGIPVVCSDKQKLNALCCGANHQGVVAFASEKDYVTLDDILQIAKERGEDPFLVIAEEIEDPHNLGALIRCAEGAGAHGVVIPKRRSAGITPVTVKSSAGATEHMAIARVTNIAAAIDALKEKGVWIYGAEADGVCLYDQALTGAAAFVMGSESGGLSRLVKEKCDFILSIPMYGKVNSFNVSTAAAVILCEAARQRNQ